MAKQCSYKKANGIQCGAPALRGKQHCVFHDRASAAKTAEARRRGGLARNKPSATLPQDTPPLRLETVKDVTAALAETYNLVRCGRLAANVGNCLGVIGQALLRAMEKGDLEKRIEELERRSA